MLAPQATRDLYLSQQRLGLATRAKVRALWRRMGSDFDASWRTVGPLIVATITQAQLQAATSASASFDRLIAETGQPNDAYGEFVPASLAGVASDGRPLGSLVYQSVVSAGQAFNGGADQGVALFEGGKFLDMAALLQIADAGRIATGVRTATNPGLHGHVRFLSPPSCQRCAVLAGRVYRWSTGFDRHPRCDCGMTPVQNEKWARSEGFVFDPTENLDNISDLSRAQRKAILDGADISQVVNAQRSMAAAGDVLSKGAIEAQIRLYGRPDTYSLAGTTSRGVYGRREIARTGTRTVERTGQRQGYIANQTISRAQAGRLTPESIYRGAKDRQDAIRLLRRFGYIL